MTAFQVVGPLVVPVYIGAAARHIRAAEGEEFFINHPAIAKRKGCYVFGSRAGKGIRPVYVGMATKTFDQECFADHKRGKYNEALADYHKGTPVLFFMVQPKKKGPDNKKHMLDLERFLIQTGVAANPELLNVKNTKQEEWGIIGVLRGGAGKPSRSASLFKRMMKL